MQPLRRIYTYLFSAIAACLFVSIPITAASICPSSELSFIPQLNARNYVAKKPMHTGNMSIVTIVPNNRSLKDHTGTYTIVDMYIVDQRQTKIPAITTHTVLRVLPEMIRKLKGPIISSQTPGCIFKMEQNSSTLPGTHLVMIVKKR